MVAASSQVIYKQKRKQLWFYGQSLTKVGVSSESVVFFGQKIESQGVSEPYLTHVWSHVKRLYASLNYRDSAENPEETELF